MKLKEALQKKKFVVTSEVQAPIDQEPEDLVRSLSQVRGRVDGVSLSEVEFEGIVGDTIKTCELLNTNQLEPIYQTTTRDKNRLQLQKDLVDAHHAGIDNLLVFTEDYRITGDSLQEMMFFHVDALAQIFESGDDVGKNFNARLLAIGGAGQLLDDPFRDHAGLDMAIQKASHAGGSQNHNFRDYRNTKGFSLFQKFCKLIHIEYRRRQEISGAQFGHFLHFFHFEIRNIFAP